MHRGGRLCGQRRGRAGGAGRLGRASLRLSLGRGFGVLLLRGRTRLYFQDGVVGVVEIVGDT